MIFLLFQVGCQEPPEKAAFVCGPYVPTGARADSLDACGDSTCAVVCGGNWCGASVSGIYCESCERWEAFKASDDCPSCAEQNYEGYQSLDCDGRVTNK